MLGQLSQLQLLSPPFQLRYVCVYADILYYTNPFLLVSFIGVDSCPNALLQTWGLLSTTALYRSF